MSDLRDMPPGTYPPIILKQDASNVPVALVPLTGSGLSESKLKDIGQNYVRNQLASVAGASVPQPFGGRGGRFSSLPILTSWKPISSARWTWCAPSTTPTSFLPAGDAQIGRYDYDIYTNSMLKGPADIAQVPIKTVGQSPVRVGDVATPEGRLQPPVQHRPRQRPARRLHSRSSRAGADSNTIAIVDGVRAALKKLYDVPSSLQTAVVFDQARFVRTAIETLIHEGGIGLFLTCLMILLFLGSLRATVAVFFSIPLSLLATFIVLHLAGSSINSMVLGGLALALSRLIDNSVVVLENIFRHLEGGEAPAVAAEKGGREVALPVLAGTLTTVVVFFPVTMLYGVSKFLFSALALAVVISLFASYFVAMTVVPLFCARFIRSAHGASPEEKAEEESDAATRQPTVRRDFGIDSMPASAALSMPCWHAMTSRLAKVLEAPRERWRSAESRFSPVSCSFRCSACPFSRVRMPASSSLPSRRRPGRGSMTRMPKPLAWSRLCAASSVSTTWE